jgi:hypothetical protein
MRLQQYILQEGRGKSISIDEAKSLIEVMCIDALKAYKNGSIIYRGVKQQYDYALINPKSGKPRVSANTSNHYTLINDNSPYWKGYPKRSESIICSTEKDVTYLYGNVYIVLPYDGAEIGVCPSQDYWYSFEKSIDSSLDQFNSNLDYLIKMVTDKKVNLKSYSSLVKSFKEFDESFNKMSDDPKIIIKNTYEFLKKYKDDDSLLKYVQKLLSPKPNGFQLKKSGDKLPKKREVWTDSKSILISYENIDIIDSFS